MQLILECAAFVVLAILCIVILVRQKKKPEEDAALRTEMVNQFHILSGMVLDTVDKAAAVNGRNVELLRRAVEEKLTEIQSAVDQKLDDTLRKGLTTSFSHVSEQLQQVYKSMGEVRALTNGVGDLKRILAGVKTRGIWGEVQLYRLLSDFLSPGQFEKNMCITNGSTVEFAVILPGNEEEKVLLPIDSKFPMDRYARVAEIGAQGDAKALEEAQKEFIQAIVTEAKKISSKYICPPKTTDFAVMFLPSEGLYAEVVRLGLMERLQSKYRVMVAGPSTLGALLTSLQMGFRTISIHEHSIVIEKMLADIKREFEMFGDTLQKTQNSLTAAQNHLESVQKRSARIRTKLADAENAES